MEFSPEVETEDVIFALRFGQAMGLHDLKLYTETKPVHVYIDVMQILHS